MKGFLVTIPQNIVTTFFTNSKNIEVKPSTQQKRRRTHLKEESNNYIKRDKYHSNNFVTIQVFQI